MRFNIVVIIPWECATNLQMRQRECFSINPCFFFVQCILCSSFSQLKTWKNKLAKFNCSIKQEMLHSNAVNNNYCVERSIRYYCEIAQLTRTTIMAKTIDKKCHHKRFTKKKTDKPYMGYSIYYQHHKCHISLTMLSRCRTTYAIVCRWPSVLYFTLALSRTHDSFIDFNVHHSLQHTIFISDFMLQWILYGKWWFDLPFAVIRYDAQRMKL